MNPLLRMQLRPCSGGQHGAGRSVSGTPRPLDGTLYVSSVEPTFRHEPDACLFVAEVGGVEASVTYRRLDDRKLDFESTFVPHSLRNQYVGTRLVRYALEWARAAGCKVVPSCWFVRQVMEREPEWQTLKSD